MSPSDTNKIYKRVKLGKNSSVGDFCLIGFPIKDKPQAETIIGDNANIRSHTVIYSGNKIGNNFQTGHGVLIRENNLIGNEVSIGSHSIIEHHVKIGNNVRIQGNTFIPEYSTIEDDAWIGPCITFTNAKYPASIDSKKHLKGPIIMEKARIGGGAVLLPGIIIGRKVLVGAGSVVTKDISDGKVVVGNPARVIKEINNLKHPDGKKVYGD